MKLKMGAIKFLSWASISSPLKRDKFSSSTLFITLTATFWPRYEPLSTSPKEPEMRTTSEVDFRVRDYMALGSSQQLSLAFAYDLFAL